MARIKNITIPKEELEAKYKELKTFTATAKYYGVNVKTITSWIEELGIEKNNIGSQGARIHNFNENYFFSIDTEHKAYWLGFLMADGCIYKGSNGNSLRLQINLATKDKEILEKFQECIKSDYKIQDKVLQEKYNVSLLKINSTVMCLDLIKHGVTERKSLICNFPTTVPEHLIRHFIRGYFDGDGCISQSHRNDKNVPYNSFNVVGGKNMLENIQQYLPNTHLYQLKNRSHIATLETGSINTINYIYEYFYKNASIFLKRKKDIFDAIVTCPLI